MALTPLKTRLLVRTREDAPKFASEEQRLLLADTLKAKLPPTQGEVLRAGAEVKKIKEGQVVVFGLGVGLHVGRRTVIIDEDDVICILRPAKA